ncbi:hypothetical protein GWI33_018049 [Rhynchophorus ferrugineus]|uniref:SWIM-type domain-containing protein n=1 Tax=Rhynchophorus ferrugineus TaxID=354439 RepID=A0A834HYJ5_RHYFE|nr:hypothetical protein GWI33_018049 [Rhynchophorus ferrugineus]
MEGHNGSKLICQNSSEKNGRSLVYSCIRSNCQGRVSKSKIRHRRVVDNKLIDGVCPSRIEVKVKNTGEVSVQFIETHVGHDDQLSFKRLTKAEENKVREQLVAGVSIDGILANARRIENGQLQRINLLKRQDVRNIINKYNIEAQQCSNDLDSAALKANEWNMERRNYAFLYKNIGQKYDGLEDEDFAVEDAGEHEFLNYLKTYYFQSEERIRMWAHCHRVGASISTNLAIESFIKLLNYNKLQRQCDIGVERLLDLLEEIVNERMWQAIINSHKKAIDLEGKVEAQGSGMFKVPSSTDNNEYYIVSTIEKCNKGCTFGYCSQCEVCLHVYKCDCPENSIKYVLCIHIHAVALFKKKAENVVDAIIENEDEHDSIHIKMENEDDIRLSVEASTSSQNESKNNILQMNFDKTLQECRKRLYALNPEKSIFKRYSINFVLTNRHSKEYPRTSHKLLTSWSSTWDHSCICCILLIF